ncbi:hypothetical protein BH24ACT5_BH24ACT5_12050 [soil metagenome]
MPDALSRPQRHLIGAVMSSIQDDGFVIAGGAALVLAGVSVRPTEDLDAFSSACEDVGAVAERLTDDLVDRGYVVEIHRSNESFARLTVTTGRWRRTLMRVELGADAQLLESVSSPLGPMLSLRELAANKVLAAFGRHETRDLVDLAALAQVVPLPQAFADAQRKDGGFRVEVLREMVARTAGVRDDLWPAGSDPDAVREFVQNQLFTTADPP